MRLLVGQAIVFCGLSLAQTQTILPTQVDLQGPEATHQLLLQATIDGRQDDQTRTVKWTSSNPSVATVDAEGVVKPISDGTTVITAGKAQAQVRVSKTKSPFTWSFRNDVIPVLTKAGCNQGACHGALAGKNGFKLTLRGYDPDVEKNRDAAREIMKKLGYGPDKRLAVTVAARNVTAFRDPAVILIDQLKQIYIDGTLNLIDTTQWYPTVMRKDYAIAFTVTETALDDPDQMFYENYYCGSDRNYTGYCNKDVDKLIDQQSAEPEPAKRKQIVWQIERALVEDGGRPIIFHPRQVTCTYPYVKGITVGVNSPYNQWRMEDAWLDR